MPAFAPITDDQLARARSDPAFRQKLLQQSLEMLLAVLKKLRSGTASRMQASPKQIREGVQLAVRLAELIQEPSKPQRGRS